MKFGIVLKEVDEIVKVCKNYTEVMEYVNKNMINVNDYVLVKEVYNSKGKLKDIVECNFEDGKVKV